MQEQENKDLIRRAVAAWNDRDRETFESLVADNAVHRTPWGTTRGEEYIDAEMDTLEKFPKHDYSIEEIVAEDDLVAVKYAVTSVPPAKYRGFETTTSDTVELDTMELFRIEDAEIAETFALVDRLSLYEQTGILNDWRIRNQYLSVLTRVLRHNLRNELGIIIGHADAILADNSDAGFSTHAESIRSVAEQLVDLGEKTRSLEQIALDEPLAPREINLTRRVQAWTAELRRRHSAAEITVDAASETLRLTTDPRLVEAILDELVENAVHHSDVEKPQLRITIEQDTSADNTVLLRVADDGPGIPPHELEPLQQESEDPLTHGSSIGLWAVKWSIERLDGELVFDENDPQGSVVTIQLPNLEESG